MPIKNLRSAVVDGVTSDIATGTLAEGARLPSTTKLAEIYKVSVATVDRAIPILRDRGLIDAVPGGSRWVRPGARLIARAYLSNGQADK